MDNDLIALLEAQNDRITKMEGRLEAQADLNELLALQLEKLASTVAMLVEENRKLSGERSLKLMGGLAPFPF